MDTSPEYIEMCEKAQEIQRVWKPIHGDIAQIQYFPGDFGVATLGHHVGTRQWSSYEKKKYTWLPRQDQLQEMVGDLPFQKLNSLLVFGNERIGRLQDCHASIATFEIFTRFSIYRTFEQLWLAFVMKEKYNKAWTGEEWQ